MYVPVCIGNYLYELDRIYIKKEFLVKKNHEKRFLFHFYIQKKVYQQ
jgi:hypothetical protein